MKRIIFSLLALWLATSTLWAYDFEVDGIYYNIISGPNLQVEVTNGDVRYTGDVVIPESVVVEGKNYSVTQIGSFAFGHNSQIRSVIIANSITKIAHSAFWYCTGLSQITIPESVMEIERYAFSYCSNLTEIIVDSNNPNYSSIDGVVFNKDQTTLIAYPAGKSGNYTIPDGVKEIAAGAFNDSEVMTSVAIPNSVTTIGLQSFMGCTGLTEVTIPNSVQTIKFEAFRGCNGLIEFLIPESVAKLEEGVFLQSDNLESIVVASNNPNYSSIDGVLFNKDQTTLIAYPAGRSGIYSIPNGVQVVGEEAFYCCNKLTEVNIPNSINKIDRGAFASCWELTQITVATDNSSYCSVDGVLFNKDKTILIRYPEQKTDNSNYVIPQEVKTIDEEAFSSCDLTSIVIPEGVIYIEYSSFLACRQLTSIIIPNSVTSIDMHAFQVCTDLTELTIGSGVKWIAQYAFDYCPLESITTLATTPPSITSDVFNRYTATLYVPAGSKAAYEEAEGWKEFSNIVELAPSPNAFTLTLTSNDETMGFVTGGGIYDKDENATIVASSQAGYGFTGWSDGNTDNPRTVTMTEDITLTAQFTEIEQFDYQVTTLVNNVALGEVSQNRAVVIEATPIGNSVFVKWSDNESSENPRVVIPTEDMTITAIFSAAVDIEDVEEQSQLKIYAADRTIHIDNVSAEEQVTVYDTLGRIIATEQILPGNNSIRLNEKGIYMIKTANNRVKVNL